MLIQIIFFAAVAMTVFLLVRRAKRYNPTEPINLSRHLVVLATGSRFLGRWLRLFLKSLNSRLFQRSERTTIPFTAVGGEHDFWQSDSNRRELELPSNLEEGDKLLAEGKTAEAEQLYLRAAAKDPSDVRAYARLGLIYLNQESYSDAIEALKIAVKLDKHNPSRHYNLALAYWGKKDVARATVAIREAIGLDPVTKKYRHLLDQLLNRQDKQSSASGKDKNDS